MKCPFCEYQHGWSGELMKGIQGDNGDFYKLPVRMEKPALWESPDSEYLYACPKCGKAFIEV